MHSDRGLDRLITFLDAVVAIAITLLVLPLAELLTGSERHADLGTVLIRNAGQFGAFLLSFAVIARLWRSHHRIGELVGGYDGAFVLVNLVWILTIVVLPFVTQVVVDFGAGPLAVGLYIGTMTLSSACLGTLVTLLHRRPALRREGVGAGDVGTHAAFATLGLLVLALVLGVAFRRVGYFALLLLLLTGPVERLLARREAARPG